LPSNDREDTQQGGFISTNLKNEGGTNTDAKKFWGREREREREREEKESGGR
jgi:hypothetical protein